MDKRYELTLTDDQMETFYQAFVIELRKTVGFPYSGRRLHERAARLLATIGLWSPDSVRVYAETVDPLSGRSLHDTVKMLDPLVKVICKAALSHKAFSLISEDGQKVLRRVAEVGLFKDFP